MTMSEKILNIQIHTYWHIGSGFGRGADVDAEVLKKNGLPFIPGRTLKGLLREGMQTAADVGRIPQTVVDEIFGRPAENGSPDGSTQGLIRVSDALLPENERNWFENNPNAAKYLYDIFGSTAINNDGVKVDRSLRHIEITVPMTLVATISGSLNDDHWKHMKMAVQFVRSLGCHRNRGLGRCTCTLEGVAQ